MLPWPSGLGEGLQNPLDLFDSSRQLMENMKKRRAEIIAKWEASGLLDNIKPTMDENFVKLLECCKTAKIERFAVYEKEPAHQNEKNGVILEPFNTKEEAEQARVKYGYGDNNYYVDKIK